MLLGLLAGCGGPGKFADETAPFSVESPAPSAPPASTAGVFPMELRIPAIELDNKTFTQVGLNPPDSRGNQSMEVPPLSQPKLVGWFKLGPIPGESALCSFEQKCVQPAVLGAHVNANGVQGAFAHLADKKCKTCDYKVMGATVEVDRSDGKTAVFKVNKVRVFSKATFDTRAVYGGSGPSLVLLTCGPGAVVNGSYLNQTVAWATLVTVKPTT